MYVVRGILVASQAMPRAGIQPKQRVNEFVTEVLFCTITNANFDDESIKTLMLVGIALLAQTS